MKELDRKLLERFGILTPAEIETYANDCPEDLVEGLIPAKSLGVLVGEWGTGKSPLIIQLLLSLAAGKPFLGGYRVKRPLRVLYCDLENGVKGYEKIQGSVSQFLGLNRVPERYFSWGQNYCKEVADPKLRAMQTAEFIRTMITELKPDLAVIDPLRVYEPEFESSNTDAAQQLQKLRNITKSQDTAICLVHHPKKNRPDGKAPEFSLKSNPTDWLQLACGAAAIVQNCDFRIGFAKEGNNLLLRAFQRNEGWSPAMDIARVFDGTDRPIGYRSKTLIETRPAEEVSLLEKLAEEFKTKDVKKLGGLHPSSADRKINDWIEAGLVERLDHGKYRKLGVGFSGLSEHLPSNETLKNPVEKIQ